MPKFILILLLFNCLQFAIAREYFYIEGCLENVLDSTIICISKRYGNVGITSQCDTIINGKFDLKDEIEETPQIINLYILNKEDSYSNDIFVDSTILRISGNGVTPSQWSYLSNCPDQIQSQKLDSVINYYNSLNNSISLSEDSLEKILNDIELTYFEKNPNSNFAVFKLLQMSRFGDSVIREKVKNIYPKIDRKYLNNIFGEGLFNFTYRRVNEFSVGDTLPVSITDVMFQLPSSDYALKEYTLIELWSYACFACQEATQLLKTIDNKAISNFQILGINLDHKSLKWNEYLINEGISWQNYSDGKSIFGGIGFEFGTKGFPTFYLVNKYGVIIQKWEGIDEYFADEVIQLIDTL